MALLFDLAVMTVSGAPGTGSTINLGGAATLNGVTFLTFAQAGVPNGQPVDYSILDPGNGGCESGTATYSSSGPSLVSRTPTVSSNSNAAINASSASIVRISPRAETLQNAALFTGGTLSNSRLTSGQFPATSTNDNANSGNIGEQVISTILSGSAVSLTSLTPANMTSISLTAGDWEVELLGYINGASTTTVTRAEMSLSTTSATENLVAGSVAYYASGASGLTPFNNNPLSFFVKQRQSLSITTSIFAVALAVFSVSTCNTFGVLRARRAR